MVATAAVYSFASGLEGYLHGRLRFPLRLALMAAGVVFVWPDTWADLTGFAILGAVTAINTLSARTILIRSASRSPKGNDYDGITDHPA